jgi:hypothetical protein
MYRSESARIEVAAPSKVQQTRSARCVAESMPLARLDSENSDRLKLSISGLAKGEDLGSFFLTSFALLEACIDMGLAAKESVEALWK